jgi:hypothetical protein
MRFKRQEGESLLSHSWINRKRKEEGSELAAELPNECLDVTA